MTTLWADAAQAAVQQAQDRPGLLIPIVIKGSTGIH